MAGTRAGGLKAAETNKRLYGDGKDGRPNFYGRIGKKGGEISRGGGLASMPEKAKEYAHLSVMRRKFDLKLARTEGDIRIFAHVVTGKESRYRYNAVLERFEEEA